MSDFEDEMKKAIQNLVLFGNGAFLAEFNETGHVILSNIPNSEFYAPLTQEELEEIERERNERFSEMVLETFRENKA